MSRPRAGTIHRRAASLARAALACAAFACTALAPGSARAEVAPGDSLLDAYVRSLSDSTDAWFGSTAAAVDTAGLDSALAAGLARRGFGRWRNPSGMSNSPLAG